MSRSSLSPSIRFAALTAIVGGCLALLVGCGSSAVDGGETGTTDAGDAGSGFDVQRDTTLPGLPCTEDAQCDKAFSDLGPCETAYCDGTTRRCARRAAPDHALCDDGDPCTVESECRAGVCRAGRPISCDDGNPCTEDACEADGRCSHAPLSAVLCDDGDPCTTGDVCAAGVCGGQTDESCVCETDRDCAVHDDEDRCNGTLTCGDDGLCHVAPDSRVRCYTGSDGPCERTACDPATGACVTGPADDGAACSDGNPCTTDDACEAGACVGTFACEPCDGDAGCAPYDDGDPCNGALACLDAECRVAPDSVVRCDGGTACAPQSCDPETGTCSAAAIGDGFACDDGDPCTVHGRCDDGACTTRPRDCDDGDPCTEDACDAEDGCTHAPLSGPVCEDGDPCTTGESCVEGVCEGGAATDCDDDDPCTDDACDPVEGCQHTWRSDDPLCSCEAAADCDDANDCTRDTCDGDGRCVFSEVGDGTACDDGSACTEDDACDAGACVGDPIECDDGSLCTADTCDPIEGCVFEEIPDCACASDGDCPDGECTIGVCDAATLRCVDEPAATGRVCDDDNPCTTDTACDGAGNCGGGAVVNCADDFDCTTDFCLPATGCVNDASGCECDPAVADACDDGNDCTADACVDYACVREPLPDGAACADDGDACTTGHVCEAGVCVFTSYDCPETDCGDGVDDDGDGATDCDDDDCAPTAACVELDCDDDIDSDGDGATDCDDADCNDAANCNPEVACLDGVDNDIDGLTDCDDPNCEAAPNCNPEGNCFDNVDNDFDGATDCDDTDCTGKPACLPEADCQNGVDDDSDGDTDCDDTDCATAPNCNAEPNCVNGIDDDLDGATDCDDPDCDDDPACSEIACLDGIDSDGDGQTDCDDPDCDDTFECLTCQPVDELPCGGQYSGTTVGGTTLTGVYPACTKEGTAFTGPEAALLFTPPVSGQTTIELQAAFDAAIVVLERACRPGTSCAAAVDVAHGNESAKVDVVGGTPYYLVIEGVDPNDDGAFTVTLTCPQLIEDCDNGQDDDDDGLVDCEDENCATSPACIELVCDDLTDNDGDGLVDCADPDCAATFLCSGCTSRQTLSCGSLVEDSTEGALNQLSRYPTCTSSSFTGPEHVYAFVPPYDMDATFTVTPTEHDPALLLLESECDATDACIGRVDAGFFGEAETLTAELEAGVTYFLVVDSFAPFSLGAYSVAVDCSAPPEICDNGVDDDGNGLGDCLDDDCEGQGCDDANACTFGDVCSLGECIAPFVVDCDDGNDCTEDTCAPATGCVHTPVLVGTPCAQPVTGFCGADGECKQTAPAGSVIITEIMKNPSCVSDDVGEWFEVYNTTGEALDLAGWRIGSDNESDHTIARSVVVAPYDYALFCREGDGALNGGMRDCSYEYGGGIALANNGEDALRLVDPGGTVIDEVAWDDGVTFPDPAGASMSLDPVVLDAAINDFGEQWCEGSSGYGSCTETRDRGTPGGVNPLCEGDFCEGAVTIECGETIGGDTTALPDVLSGYACTGRAQSGGEQVYAFQTPVRLRVTAEVAPVEGVDLDLNLLRDNCAPADCVGFGERTIDFSANAFTTYYVVVDGYAGARGAYDLTLTCSDESVENCGNQIDDDEDGDVDCDDLDCDEDPFCTEFCTPSDVALACDRVIGGTTVGQPNDITTYSCTSALTRGGETAYPFTPEVSGPVTFTLSYEGAPFLDLYVLDNTCGDTVCVAQGDFQVTIDAQAGRTYYVVVDGRAGTVGDYALATDCDGGVAVEIDCDDELDGDGDELVDCRDADCRFDPYCHERTCDDNEDDDGDGLIDCEDPDCDLSRACFACVDATPIACGETLPGTTVDGEDRLHAYDCSERDATGPEVVYAFTSDGNGTVSAALSNVAGGDLDVYALGQACEPDGCRAAGEQDATLEVSAGQTIYFVVDGFEGAAGSFDLELLCDLTPPELCTGGGDEDFDGLVDCADPDCDGLAGCAEVRCSDGLDDEGDGLVDCDDPDCDTVRVCNPCAEAVEVFCGDLVFGTTTGLEDAISRYGCADWDETGGEAVYRYRTNETTDVVVDLGAFEDDLDVLVLDQSCDGASCVARGVQGAFFTALPGRDYFIVVDGYQGATGAYQLALGCAGIAETCGDDRDNDGDGLTDCDDSDCYGNPSCPEVCDDDIDNDGDGRRDCDDSDCDLAANCAEFCTTDQVVACGQTITGTTAGEDDEVFNWQGCAVITASGGEASHELAVPGTRIVTATLTTDAELLLFATAEVCADRRCIAFGGNADTVTFTAEPDTSYYLVVDGFLGSAGSYELEIACTAGAEDVCDDGVDEDADGFTDCQDEDCAEDAACVVTEDCTNGEDDDGDGAIDCADADCAEVLDCVEACTATAEATCDRVLAGATVGAPNTMSYHPACTDRLVDGGEFVYQLTVAEETTLAASFTNGTGAGLDLFLLEDACDTASCVAWGEDAFEATLAADRTYYVVVDGAAGAEALFDLKLDCGGDDTGCFTEADCARPECADAPLCASEAVCDDGVDDDGDGDVDCADPDCVDDPLCQPDVENCADGVDNDGDGAADCFDLDDCLFHPVCDIACPAPVGTVACDAAVTGDNADGVTLMDVYGTCSATATLAGPEVVYAFTPDTNVVATATLAVDGAASLRLLLLEEPCGAQSCAQIDADGEVVQEVQAGTTYYWTVDGASADDAAPFTLRVQCSYDSEVFCDDGRDDDGDAAIDCADDDCAAFPGCTEIDCSDGDDDDGDGAIDCADSDCAADPACVETACANGVDDEGDGLADCNDGDCWDDAACDCAPGATAFACDELLIGSLAAGTSRYDVWPCGAAEIAATGPEAVYSFTPATDATLSLVDATATADSVAVYVMEGACALSSCVLGTPDTLVPVTAGVTYHVVVDGRDGYAGDYLILTACLP